MQVGNAGPGFHLPIRATTTVGDVDTPAVSTSAPQERFERAPACGPAATRPSAGHPAGCPCCSGPPVDKLGTTSAQAAGQAVMGAPGGYLATTPELRARLDALTLKPDLVNYVLYHENCFDGFGARCAAQELLGDRAIYLPVHYDAPPPELPPDARVAIVDFSYPREQLEELKSKVADLVVLDHHKKAKDDLGGLPYAVFEMDRAGAGLSWAYFHPDRSEPELYKYLEDRDLWKFNLDHSHEVSSAIASYPMDFDTWQSLDIGTLKQEGVALERYKQQLVSATADEAVKGTICGHQVPVANSQPQLRSEVGAELLKRNPEAPFAAIYYLEDGQRMWSVRSRGDFDVNEIAKRFGGGGHAAAAGFRDPGPIEQIVLQPPDSQG